MTMPQLPIIIPIIVTGLLVGSAMRNPDRRISKKRIGGASVLSGVLNAAEAYVVNLLTPQPTSTFFRAGSTVSFTVPAAARQSSELVFYVSSVLAGILIPLVIVGIAMFYSRGRHTEEEVEEETETQDLDSEK
jgi:hypothetical protein